MEESTGEGSSALAAAADLVLHLVPSLHKWAIASLVSILMAATASVLLLDQRRFSEATGFEPVATGRRPFVDRSKAFPDPRRVLARKAAAALARAYL